MMPQFPLISAGLLRNAFSTGDTVIDSGSGAGNDCFIARKETGETGKVIGIDYTRNGR